MRPHLLLLHLGLAARQDDGAAVHDGEAVGEVAGGRDRVAVAAGLGAERRREGILVLGTPRPEPKPERVDHHGPIPSRLLLTPLVLARAAMWHDRPLPA